MTPKKIQKTHESTFESIRKTNQHGQDFWSARDFSKILEYSEFRHFIPVLNKAKEACKNSNQIIKDHFEDVLEMVSIGSGAQREIQDVKLSRYACYLIVQNADPAKPIVALGQTYFAVQMRKQELIEEIGGTMPENLPSVESIKLVERKQEKRLWFDSAHHPSNHTEQHRRTSKVKEHGIPNHKPTKRGGES